MTDGKVLPNLEDWGLAYSIIGLTFAVISILFFRHHARFLDYLQFSFLWAGFIQAKNSGFTNIFSIHLDESWISFIPTFFEDTTSLYLVLTGYLLSFAICLFGFYLILFLILAIIKCANRERKTEVVYRIFKGLLKWLYLPLYFLSLNFIIAFGHLGSGYEDGDMAGAAIVFSFLTIFVLVQPCVYKCLQNEQENQKPKKYLLKWAQLLQYTRIWLVCLLVSLSAVLDTEIPLYVLVGVMAVYIPLLLSVQIHQQSNVRKCFHTVWHILGEGAILTILSLMIWNPQSVSDYDLDYFLLTFVLLLDIIYYIAMFIRGITKKCKRVGEDSVGENSFKETANQTKMYAKHSGGDTQGPINRDRDQIKFQPSNASGVGRHGYLGSASN